jgi:hypothetical protein
MAFLRRETGELQNSIAFRYFLRAGACHRASALVLPGARPGTIRTELPARAVQAPVDPVSLHHGRGIGSRISFIRLTIRGARSDAPSSRSSVNRFASLVLP